MFVFLSLILCLLQGTCWSLEPKEVGKWSYGTPLIKSWGEGTNLTIGKFCSIAADVTVLLGGNHRTDWISTFPFTVLWPEVAGHIEGHPATKGDVVIGNDVWVGRGATILSGVHVGDGAVIGAKSVVSKDVPPYAIVCGNPARIKKYRFDEETIQKLVAISWWNWPDEEIEKVVELLMSQDIGAFIEYCEQTGKLPH